LRYIGETEGGDVLLYDAVLTIREGGDWERASEVERIEWPRARIFPTQRVSGSEIQFIRHKGGFTVAYRGSAWAALADAEMSDLLRGAMEQVANRERR